MSGPESNSFSCNVTARISFPKPSPARVSSPARSYFCERHFGTVTPATGVLLTARSAATARTVTCLRAAGAQRLLRRPQHLGVRYCRNR